MAEADRRPLKHVQSVDLQVEDGPLLWLEFAEEDPYGFGAIALAVVDRLHARHQVVSQRINASKNHVTFLRPVRRGRCSPGRHSFETPHQE